MDNQRLTITQGEDKIFRGTLPTPTSISGWTLGFSVHLSDGVSPIITKTTGSGITIENASTGIIAARLLSADTVSLTPSAELSGQRYWWQLWRTDSGANALLAKGWFVVEKEYR